jgi:hypothetical protein
MLTKIKRNKESTMFSSIDNHDRGPVNVASLPLHSDF